MRVPWFGQERNGVTRIMDYYVSGSGIFGRPRARHNSAGKDRLLLTRVSRGNPHNLQPKMRASSVGTRSHPALATAALPCSDGPDTYDKNESDQADRADEDNREAIPLVMRGTGLPALHPASEGLGMACQCDPESIRGRPGGFVVGSEG